MAAKSKERPTMTVAELAQYLGISRVNAYAEVRAGRIPHIRIGSKRIVIPRRAVERWLETCAGSLPAA